MLSFNQLYPYVITPYSTAFLLCFHIVGHCEQRKLVSFEKF